jgi:hypothetical protein
MQLWSIEEENGQGLDQARPLRLETVYRLVIGEASSLMTVEVDVTGKCCQAHSLGTQNSAVRMRRLTDETHQATWGNP